jgi:hypothetical protein
MMYGLHYTALSGDSGPTTVESVKSRCRMGITMCYAGCARYNERQSDDLILDTDARHYRASVICPLERVSPCAGFGALMAASRPGSRV